MSYAPTGGLESGFHMYFPPIVILFGEYPNSLCASYWPGAGEFYIFSGEFLPKKNASYDLLFVCFNPLSISYSPGPGFLFGLNLYLSNIFRYFN
jgi:hypothetical protein